MSDLAAHRAIGVLTAIVCIVAGAEEVRGQSPMRSGLWVELGLGPSLATAACAGCADPSLDGAGTVYGRLGGTVASGVFLGVELAAHTTDTFSPVEPGEAGRVEVSNLSAVVLWAPLDAGFLVKGGIGIADGRVSVDPGEGAAAVARGTGVGLTFGAGWDFPVSSRLSISANAATWVSAVGDIVLPSRRVEDVIATEYGVTIGLTLR